MKNLAVVSLALAVAVVVRCAPAEEKYTTRYDNIDIQNILKNERLFRQYYNCLIDKGSCTPDGAELKGSIRDALETQCSKCSEKQKAGSETVLKFLISKKPKEYEVLERKYDPQRNYRKRYEKEADKLGIVLPA